MNYFADIREGVLKNMRVRRNFKLIVLLLALALQGAFIDGLFKTGVVCQPCEVTGQEFNNVRIQLGEGETPEAGTIFLLGLGYLLIRKRYHKK